MNIRELIELLQEYPEEWNVFVCSDDGVYVNHIRINSDMEGEIDIIGEE